MAQIQDPRTHRTAYVNKKHRLEVDSTARSEGLAASEGGLSYNINTGLISLTNSTATPILYFENHEDHDVVIEALAVGFDDLGTHTGTPVIRMIRNPTSIDFSTDVDMKQNRNFSSTKQLKDATLAYKGAVGDTVTGGDEIAMFFQQEGGRLFASIDFVIGVGNSLCITVDAQVTGGTCQVYGALIIYLHEDIN